MSQKKNKRPVYLPIILALVLITGMYIGGKLKFNSGDSHFFIYPQTNKLSSIIDYIKDEYVDSVSTNKLIDEAIPVILDNLDPHSVYIPAKDLQRTNEPLEGNFDGIGVEFNIQKDTIIIVNTILGGPSEKAGLLAGDRIVLVNDSLIAGTGITNNDVIKLLKGKSGTTVKLGIKRSGTQKLLYFEIIRDKIPLYSIDASFMIDDSTGYIKISRFSRTTYDEFVSSIEKLQSQGLENVIVDLRGNGGGYLEIATELIDEFLEADKLMVYTEGRARPKTEFYSGSKGICKNYNLIVLIDEFSASASEIFAGAIQDNDRGVIVGRRSFGKGLVQEQTRFPDGSGMRLTVARYYTPSGRCIQKSYSNGNNDYFHELSKRYEHGEFSVKDSINFKDTLKYYTSSGRVVYGGGGIMPDVFVPVDTSEVSAYYSKVQNMALIYKFAFEYTDKRRQEFKEFENYKELISYLKTKKLVSKFVKFAQKEGVKANWKDINYSKNLLKTVIMAQVSRNVFDNKGYYPVISTIDMTLQKAIGLINDNELSLKGD